MSDWHERPSVESALLNPALIALVLSRAAFGYSERHSDGMTWPLGFIVPPLVLHRPTRKVLPRDTRTHLSTWVSRNPLLRTGFPRRAASMTELTREGFRFGIRTGDISLHAGLMHGVNGREPRGELLEIVKAAKLVGRWLSMSESPSTPFVLLGVRP